MSQSAIARPAALVGACMGILFGGGATSADTAYELFQATVIGELDGSHVGMDLTQTHHDQDDAYGRIFRPGDSQQYDQVQGRTICSEDDSHGEKHRLDMDVWYDAYSTYGHQGDASMTWTFSGSWTISGDGDSNDDWNWHMGIAHETINWRPGMSEIVVDAWLAPHGAEPVTRSRTPGHTGAASMINLDSLAPGTSFEWGMRVTIAGWTGVNDGQDTAVRVYAGQCREGSGNAVPGPTAALSGLFLGLGRSGRRRRA